jgi:hypothetical protein
VPSADDQQHNRYWPTLNTHLGYRCVQSADQCPDSSWGLISSEQGAVGCTLCIQTECGLADARTRIPDHEPEQGYAVAGQRCCSLGSDIRLSCSSHTDAVPCCTLGKSSLKFLLMLIVKALTSKTSQEPFHVHGGDNKADQMVQHNTIIKGLQYHGEMVLVSG